VTDPEAVAPPGLVAWVGPKRYSRFATLRAAARIL
jgi:hypothetical protein